MSALATLWRRLSPIPPPADLRRDAAKDAIDARLDANALRLAAVARRADEHRRDAEYRRFRDEYEARRPADDRD